MILCHVNEEQKTALEEWLCRHSSRPSSEVYLRENRQFTKLRPSRKPRPNTLSHCLLGFEETEVKPEKGFDARRDMPAGWALVNVHDSGFNHVVSPAGHVLHRELWNLWGCAPKEPLRALLLHPSLVMGARVRRELEANSITF